MKEHTWNFWKKKSVHFNNAYTKEKYGNSIKIKDNFTPLHKTTVRIKNTVYYRNVKSMHPNSKLLQF
jgi:hypothetical protein